MAPSRVSAAPRRPLLWLCGIVTILMVVFAYLLALAIAAGLGLLTIGVLGSHSLVAIIIATGAATCSASILWSLAPRRDNFTPPGPAIDPASQPRLFGEIAAIAAEFSEPMPSAVYLMLDPNAWVAQRGGMLGFGSRRVMALGFPLLSVLTVSEFRAVVAHEFAHYYGGDTGFGPWTQKARDALMRSLQRLSGESGFLSFLSRWAYVAILRIIVIYILALYWKLFLRLTLLVSRQWEYRADELASAVAGATPLVNGLRKIPSAALAWQPFWTCEAVPSLSAGFRPPLAEGFSRFLEAPEVARKLAPRVSEQLEQETPGAFDTHPTFHQRSERALAHGFDPAPEDPAPAISLLDGPAEFEFSVLRALFPDSRIEASLPVAWESTGIAIYVPLWGQFTSEYRAVLEPYTVADIPDALANLSAIAARIRDPKGTLLTRDQRADRAASLLWMAFSLVLFCHGWELHAQPGDFHFAKGRDQLIPSDLVLRLRQGILSAEGYRDLVAHFGIGILPLAPPEAPPAGVSPIE